MLLAVPSKLHHLLPGWLQEPPVLNFPIRICPPCSQLSELPNVSVPPTDAWQLPAAPPHHGVRLKTSPACLGLICFHTHRFLLPPGSCLAFPETPSPARLPCLLLLKSSGPCVHGRFPLDLQLPLICRADQDIKALPQPSLIVPLCMLWSPKGHCGALEDLTHG